MFISLSTLIVFGILLWAWADHNKKEAEQRVKWAEEDAEKKRLEALMTGQGLNYRYDELLREVQKMWPKVPLNQLLTENELDYYSNKSMMDDEDYYKLIELVKERGAYK